MAENLLESFNSFDKLPCVAVNETALDAYSKGNVQNSKIRECNELIKKAQKRVNSIFNSMGVTPNIKFNTTFSCGSENLFRTRTSYTKKDGAITNINLGLNVNANKLTYPALEFYSMVSALAYKTILANVPQNKRSTLQENTQRTAESQEPQLEDTVRHDNDLAQIEVAKWFLREYLKDFLKEAYPNQFDGSDKFELNFIAEQIASDVVDGLSKEEVGRLPKVFFSGFHKYDDLLSRKSRNYIPSNDLYKMRTEKLRENANQFAADTNADYSNAEALGYEQQFVALSSTFAGKNDKVKAVLASGFSNDNAQLRKFCQDYADSFMASNKLKPIQVNFVNSGGCNYTDKGSTHEIKINLSSPMFKGGNISELLMTLSHELTHAVDSSINKVNGNVTEEGYGLLNSMSEDLSVCDEESARPLLEQVQSFCYQLNPNERHARIGELSAVKFMSELYADDPEMQQQMHQSMERYKNYQETTIRCSQILPQKIAEFKSKMESLHLSKSSKAYQMIKERIEYLERISADYSCEAEKASIEDLQKISRENSNKNNVRQNVSAQEMQ